MCDPSTQAWPEVTASPGPGTPGQAGAIPAARRCRAWVQDGDDAAVHRFGWQLA